MKAVLAIVALVLVATLLLEQTPYTVVFKDVDIIFNPDADPKEPERWPNGSCVTYAWDYWQDSCNARMLNAI